MQYVAVRTDGGKLLHAMWHDPSGPWPGWRRALCSAQPGSFTSGWSAEPDRLVTCQRCINTARYRGVKL